jgi:hypothetical protein
MTTDQVLILARKHIGKGSMESSARLCLDDAMRLVEDGKLDLAKDRAIKSLAYSIGLGAPDYMRACGHVPAKWSRD